MMLCAEAAPQRLRRRLDYRVMRHEGGEFRGVVGDDLLAACLRDQSETHVQLDEELSHARARPVLGKQVSW
jgi:hypothetical protein